MNFGSGSCQPARAASGAREPLIAHAVAAAARALAGLYSIDAHESRWVRPTLKGKWQRRGRRESYGVGKGALRGESSQNVK